MKIEKRRVIGFYLSLIILTFLLSGCSSYSDCVDDCYQVYDELKDDYCYRNIIGYPMCRKVVSDDLRQICYDKCRNTE